jgi:REP element-mobilizing transposase RayT
VGTVTGDVIRQYEELVGYWRQVCDQKRWIAWDIEVVSEHAHLFLGLRPVNAPQSVALSLMNSSKLRTTICVGEV